MISKKKNQVSVKSKIFFVIDDEEGIRDLLKMNLMELYPCNVECFSTADDAIKALDNCKSTPDVILSDVRMPGTSGFRLGSKLADRNLDIPIVLITGLTGEEVFEGKNIVLSKPLNLRKIKFIIDKILQ